MPDPINGTPLLSPQRALLVEGRKRVMQTVIDYTADEEARIAILINALGHAVAQSSHRDDPTYVEKLVRAFPLYVEGYKQGM